MSPDMSLKVKLIPDLTELNKALKGLVIGAGKVAGGPARAAAGDKPVEKGNKQRSRESNKILNSLKGILKFVGITAFVSSIFLGLIRIIEPIFKLLGVVLALLFVPLIPIMKKVLIKLGEFAGKIATSAGDFLSGDIDFSEFVGEVVEAFKTTFLGDTEFGEVLTNIFDTIIKLITENSDAVVEGVTTIFDALGTAIADNSDVILSSLFNALLDLGIAVVLFGKDLGDRIANRTREAVEFFKKMWDDWINDMKIKLKDVSFWVDALMNAIKSGLNPLRELGSFIFKLIKSFFKGDGDEEETSGPIKNDFLMRPGQGAVNFSPDDTIMGVKDPSKLGVGGGFTFTPTININASINSEIDIRRMAEQIAQIGAEELSRKTGSLRF